LYVASPGCFVPLHSLEDRPRPLVELYPVAVNTMQMSCDNYYHFTMECLTRLVLALDHLATLPPTAYEGARLVVPGGYGGGKGVVQAALAEIARVSGPHAAMLSRLNVTHYHPSRAFSASVLYTVEWRQLDDRPGLELTPPRAALHRVGFLRGGRCLGG
jgi:hypothetical protein